MTERVTKGNQSLESPCAPGNKELLKTKLFLTFDFVYHPLKIALAIRWNILSHKRFGRHWLYVMAIYGYLEHVRFTQSQDLISNSLYCLPYSSCDVSFENLVLDQLIIPLSIFFFIFITCLLDIVLIV